MAEGKFQSATGKGKYFRGKYGFEFLQCLIFSRKIWLRFFLQCLEGPEKISIGPSSTELNKTHVIAVDFSVMVT